ncbi:MAG: hypothetical protein R3B57_14720 [Phycisphaerales bacterium]
MPSSSRPEFVGGYAIERAVWDSDLGGVYEARAPLSDACKHVVKIRRVAPGEGAGVGERGVARLLDAAGDQRRAGEREPQAWALVVESGQTEDGSAFVVRERYACSLRDLFNLRARVGSETMASIIEPVLRGLAALRDTCSGRAHGALKPENVLLDPPKGGRRWRAVVTDPLPSSLLGEESASDDLRRVGRFIERLATGRAAGRPGEGDWSTLGRSARAWRELSEELQSKDDQPTLDGALGRVRGIVARRKRARRRAVGATVGVGVLAIAGAGSAWYLATGDNGLAKGGTVRAPFEADSFRRWCADADSWVLYLERQAVDKRAELSKDPYLATAVVAVVDEAATREIELDPKAFVRADPRSRLRLIDFLEEDERNRRLGGRTTEAMDIIGRLRAGLARWDSARQAEERARTYRERGWGPQATTLARLAASVHPPEWVDRQTGMLVIPDEIDMEFGPRMVPAMLDLIRADAICDEVDAAWDRIQERTPTIVAAGKADGEASPADPVLARFGEVAGAYVSFSGIGGDMKSLESLADRVGRLDTLSESLAAFCESGWGGVDREFFGATSKTLASYDAKARATPELFESWLGEASQERVKKLDPADDPRLAYGGREGFEQLASRLSELGDQYGGELLNESLGDDTLPGRLDELTRRAGQTDGIIWKRLSQERIETEAGELNAAHDEIASALDNALTRMQGVASAYEQSVRGAESMSQLGIAPIDEAWRRARDDLLARYASDQRYADLRRDVEGAQAKLEEIEGRLSPELGLGAAPRELDVSRLQAVARQRASERAAAVLTELSWADGRFVDSDGSGDTLDRLAQEQAEWGQRVRTLGTGHADVESRLDEAYALDEAGAGGKTIRGELKRVESITGSVEPEVVGALASVRDRVTALEGLESVTDPHELVRIGAEAGVDRPALRVAAYEAIDRVGGATWATRPEDLRSDLTALSAALESSERIEDAARMAEVRDRVRDEGRARWTRFASAADSVALLDDALSVMPAYAGSVDDLPGRARYNMRLREFEKGVDLKMDEDSLRVRVARLRDQLAPAVAGMDAGSDARRFQEEVAELAEPPSDDRPPLDAQDFGPGAHGWDGYDVEGGERLVYSWPTRENPELRIEFVRVEATSDNGLDRPAYIAAQETSLAVVILAGQHLGGQTQDGTWIADWDKLVEVWNNLQDARERAPKPGGQEWAGPRAWRWLIGRGPAGDELGVGESWLKRHSQMTLPDFPAYPPGLGDPNDALLIARSQGRPSRMSPAQDVSFSAAEVIAGALGCRLPRDDEWAAAFALGVGVVDPGAWNLRDRTFARQRDWIRSLDQRLLADSQTSQFQYPDRDAFLDDYTGGQGEAAQTLDSDDGVLWFEPVGSGRGTVFEDLIGNVAEFVTTADGFGIVGGSALSPPDLSVVTVRPVKNYRKRRSFTDVGFRLALEVPDGVFRQSVNRRLEKLLARATYVFE